MKNRTSLKQLNHALILALALFPAAAAFAFTSGSTGVDGAFNPTVNTILTLPPDGIKHYTTVNIPVGVVVTFKKNATNTPAVILATGDVTIAGTLQAGGTNSTDVGAAGDGNLGDEGLPGLGGPGGYDGGSGGIVGLGKFAGAGLGPGGGSAGNSFFNTDCYGSNIYMGGGGGGFSAVGAHNSRGTDCSNTFGLGGASYGSSALLPLIGGSGGGGGSGGTTFLGSGGGGGGGAILIASSGVVNVTGSILANGGNSGASVGAGQGSTGGGGAGGGIRIMATTIAGNGAINAIGGIGIDQGTGEFRNFKGGNGAPGRIRLEGETISRVAATTPTFTQAVPSVVFVSGLPSLRISTVAGVAAPADPTGKADITLAAATVNPVAVTFTTTGVPVGNTIKLTVTPQYGATSSVVTPAITGTVSAGTASTSITLPSGPSVLSATVTYSIVASLGIELSKFAQGERVEKIRLSASTGGPSEVTLITISGKEYTMPSSQIPVMSS